MKAVEHLKSINEKVAEPYIRLALAYFSEHLVSGKHSSPAVTEFNLKEIASKYLHWEEQERKAAFDSLGINPVADDGNWPSSEDWSKAEQTAMGGHTQQEWDEISTESKTPQDEEETEAEAY